MSSTVETKQPVTTPPPAGRQPTVSDGLTVRAVITGIVLTILLSIWAIHSSYVTQASNISVTHLPLAALFPFVLVVLFLNPLLKIILPGRGLNKQEVIVVFFLIFTASAIPGWAFSTYAISVISGPTYFVSPENRWAELFMDYFPSWLIVPDHNEEAITWFFEGAPAGFAIPWQAWVVPMFWWGTFYLAIFLVSASLMVIFRKQWVEHERLTFPLAQVPLMLVEGIDEPHPLPKIARSRLFWVGFSITCAILMWNILSFFGDLPSIPLGPGFALPFTIAPSYPPINIMFNFLLAGIAYFTRVEVLLSVWFFSLLRIVEQGTMSRVGIPDTVGLLRTQFFSGFLVYVVFVIWVARKHLKQVWMTAMGKSSELDDKYEFFTYRTAALGLVCGVIYMFFWLYTAGMSAFMGMLLLTVLMIMFFGVTRVVAETGLVSFDLPSSSATEVSVQLVGSANVSPQTLTTMWLNMTISRNWRTLGMMSIIHCAKVGDQMGGIGKGVFGAMAVTLGLSFVTSLVYTLYLGYDIGASQFAEPAFKSGAEGYWNGLAGVMTNPKGMTSVEFLYFCIGAGVSAILVFGHHRFVWWPLHPVGFGVVMTHSANMGFFSIFIVWVIKSLLMGIGGVQLYKKMQPAVIGMLAGYAVCVFLSWLVDEIWFPGNGHLVHSW